MSLGKTFDYNSKTYVSIGNLFWYMYIVIWEIYVGTKMGTCLACQSPQLTFPDRKILIY